MENKRGWIRIVEAVISILLIAGVLLIVISQGYVGRKDISSQFYDVEISILREVQLNDSLRADVLNSEVPVEWDDAGFPSSIKDKVNLRIPNYFECKAKICKVGETCELSNLPKKDTYAEMTIITTVLETEQQEQLKQLKLFCWLK